MQYLVLFLATINWLALALRRSTLDNNATFTMQSYLFVARVHMNGIFSDRILPGRLNREIPALLPMNVPDRQLVLRGHDNTILRALPLPEPARQFTFTQSARLIQR